MRNAGHVLLFFLIFHFIFVFILKLCLARPGCEEAADSLRLLEFKL